ncbi:hypothetical protein WJX81_003264 [Elliptochloris bilobata]|uniref:Uncharacterized protein n=1 Tax=Elliptochloris bilobata TaxID=381761 RepID=A0AAW1RMN2_9CHLO
MQTWWQAQAELDAERTWFWFLDAERRRAVKKKKEVERSARARVRELERRRERLLSDAKASLGLWSAAGVDEGRQLFWRSFEAGKGLCVSVFAFLFQVPRLVAAYQANFINGALFFMMCAIASVSVVATFLVGLYAAGATAVYAAATLIAPNRRLGPGGAPPPGLRYHVD